jgi:tetratricopeptide (TPR) repeat protein
MDFDVNNKIVKLCLQGMDMEDKGKADEARIIFLQAWNEAASDFEKFTAAYYVARYQKSVRDKLKWHQTALQFAFKIDNETVFPSLYLNIAKCYEDLSDFENAKTNHELALSFTNKLSDKGPFYHGTKADLQVGDLLTAGFRSNYKPEVVMNHIYFTANVYGAGLAAEIIEGDGRERVYIVEPTGGFENDPNVTDKKFPGNPTRSYRSQAPLKIVGEVTEWQRLTPEVLQAWRERLRSIRTDSKSQIIN